MIGIAIICITLVAKIISIIGTYKNPSMKKKEQEVDVLKALLAKLQKYGRNVDHHSDQISLSNGSSGDQKRKGHNTANTKREVCSLMFNGRTQLLLPPTLNVAFRSFKL